MNVGSENEVSYRRTVVRGKLHAHYEGRLNPQITVKDCDQYFDIQIIQGTIQTEENDIHRNIGEQAWETYVSGSSNENKLKISSEVVWIINLNKDNEFFSINHEKFDLITTKNIKFSNCIYEDDRVYGTIHCDIVGYYKERFVKYHAQDANENIEEIEEPVIIPIPTPPGKPGNPDNDTVKPQGCWDMIQGTFTVLAYVWIGLVVISLIINAWPLLLLIIAFIISNWFLSKSAGISNALHKIIGWIFSLLLWTMLLSAIYYLFHHWPKNRISPTEESEQSEEEVQELVTTPDVFQRIMEYTLPNDSIERQIFAINLRDLGAETIHRNNISVSLNNKEAYRDLLSQIHMHSIPNLDWICDTLDMIRNKHALNDRQFFEVILNWTQQIPYSLVLDNKCYYRLYRDPFIIQGLQSGMDCIPEVPYGLLTPLENILYGRSDCDSKSLLLFSVLKKFDFDIVFISSSVDRHAIVGVGIPYPGYKREILGRSFTLLETTALSPPGILAKPKQPYKHWDVNLIHLAK